MSLQYILSLKGDFQSLKTLVVSNLIDGRIGESSQIDGVLNVELVTEHLSLSVFEFCKITSNSFTEIETNVSVSFQLHKDCDKVHVQKESIIRHVMDIIIPDLPDATFSFNGEDMLLYVKGKVIFVNQHFKFWQQNTIALLREPYRLVDESGDFEYRPC